MVFTLGNHRERNRIQKNYLQTAFVTPVNNLTIKLKSIIYSLLSYCFKGLSVAHIQSYLKNALTSYSSSEIIWLLHSDSSAVQRHLSFAYYSLENICALSIIGLHTGRISCK